MTVRINSNELRELGIRNTPSIETIGNGYIVRYSGTEDLHRDNYEDAITLFEQRQDQFIKDVKEQAQKQIDRYQENIQKEKDKISKVEDALASAQEQLNKQLERIKPEGE